MLFIALFSYSVGQTLSIFNIFPATTINNIPIESALSNSLGTGLGCFYSTRHSSKLQLAIYVRLEEGGGFFADCFVDVKALYIHYKENLNTHELHKKYLESIK